MKPMWVIVCVCVGVAIVFMSFLEMLRFPGAKKLIFPHFWHRIPHINWLLPQLCKKQKKKKPLQTHNSAIQWTHFPCAPVCYSTHDWASAFDQSCFGWFEIFGLDTDINIHALANTLTHTIFPICFFSPQMIDEYSFWCIDWMLLWNYIFGAGWALEERQIGLTKWE